MTNITRRPNEPTWHSDAEQSCDVVRLNAQAPAREPEQKAPLQRASFQPDAGRATSRTRESFGKNARQARGQEMPRGLLVTRP